MKALPTGYQLKAARSLIGWSQADLAKASGIDPATVVRMEKTGHDHVSGLSKNLQHIIRALAKEGVEFVELGVILTRNRRSGK
jgi:transcriptional regulator with XRE-family HTH domain